MTDEFKKKLEAALEECMRINDFESALATRPDKGAIYTNEIIIGWLRDTFALAWTQARTETLREVFESREFEFIVETIEVMPDGHTESARNVLKKCALEELAKLKRRLCADLEE